MSRLLMVAVIASLAALFAGCATIAGGPTRTVKIESEPAGATVTFNGEVKGVTPLKVKLDRSRTRQEISLQLDGHRPWSTVMTRDVKGWYYANILFNSGLGMIPDAILGSKYTYFPRHIEAQLMSNEAWAEAQAKAQARLEQERQERAAREFQAERRRVAQEVGRRGVERSENPAPGKVQYSVPSERIMGAGSSDLTVRVNMGLSAEWPAPAPGGTVDRTDVELKFQFVRLAPELWLRETDKFVLRCTDGRGGVLIDQKPSEVRWYPGPEGHRFEFIYFKVTPELLSTIDRTNSRIGCQLERRPFEISPAFVHGISELLKVLPRE